MCETCGCGQPETHAHDHEHRHEHDHHEHEHHHEHAAKAQSKTLTLERNVFARNDQLAQQNHEWLKSHGILAVNLISSPGAGKTTLLEKTLERLRDRVPCGVIVGDQQTDQDARRLSGKGAPVRQIETINSCHLDAERVGAFLPEVVGDAGGLLFIENVGNLICPAAFNLGEDFKIALLSVTEGEDKPIKYPVVFSKAEVVVLTKIDLVPHLDWSRDTCLQYLRQICPGAKVFELSARTGEGMDQWIEYLGSLYSDAKIV